MPIQTSRIVTVSPFLISYPSPLLYLVSSLLRICRLSSIVVKYLVLYAVDLPENGYSVRELNFFLCVFACLWANGFEWSLPECARKCSDASSRSWIWPLEHKRTSYLIVFCLFLWCIVWWGLCFCSTVWLPSFVFWRHQLHFIAGDYGVVVAFLCNLVCHIFFCLPLNTLFSNGGNGDCLDFSPWLLLWVMIEHGKIYTV